MGNTHVKPHPRTRNKKQVHWRAADRPSPPGKPSLVSENGFIPDVIKITWTKSQNDGGAPINGYLVEHKRLGSPHWVRANPVLVSSTELAVSGLEPGWRYQFRVSAENAVGLSDPSEPSELLTVTLQRSAITAPRFTQEVQDTTALEDAKVEFVVTFLGQPAPTLCWFKDGFEIFSSRRTRIITDHEKSILTIHQSSISDEGEIKCTATNRAGHASTKAKLTLEAPPSVRLPRQYEDGIIFEIGEVIKLKVTVAGRPTPLIFWSHNGESINNDDRHEMEFVDNCSILKIENAKRTDRGEYQLRAVNKLGQDSASFLVTVTDKPTPPGKAKVVMALGRSVTLSWDIPNDDGGCKIGNYIIEYYRIGWDVWLKAATSRQLTTILGDLIEGSEYKFRVKAESPYGVSEPSEESETVFIPDPKRGLLESNQALNYSSGVLAHLSPESIRNNNPHLQTQPKTDLYDGTLSNELASKIPVRPKRTKIRSPSKTPEVSPRFKRKQLSPLLTRPYDELNSFNFDRTSMARELAYGIPIGKQEKLSPLDISSDESNKMKSRTPSPNYMQSSMYDQASVKPKNVSLNIQNPGQERKSTSPSPTKNKTSSFSFSEKKESSPIDDYHRNIVDGSESYYKIDRNNRERSKTPTTENQNLTGSSEFMLVLYPEDDNKKGMDHFDFNENSVPPPLSLSAPELGVEPPIMENLRRSASSTELLNIRLLERLNEALIAEELREEQRHNELIGRRLSLEIPTIQINSKPKQEIVGLDQNPSLSRRLSAGVISQQNRMMIQRRQSLKTASELSDVLENKLHKFPDNAESKRELMMMRQRSESEEIEEEVFEKVRQKMAVGKQNSTEKRNIDVADESKWQDEEYISSEETSYTSDDDRPPLPEIPPLPNYDSEEEPYHPSRKIIPLVTAKKISDEPFEIFTKPKQPPDPNLVVKPILKKRNMESDVKTSTSRQYEINTSKTINDVVDNKRNKHFEEDKMPQTETKQTKSSRIIVRNRSNSLIPTLAFGTKKDEQKKPKGGHISALAQMTSIAGAGIVLQDQMGNKKDDEDSKRVVADHYADIVKNYGNKTQLHNKFSRSGELQTKKFMDSKKAPEKISPYHIQAKTEEPSLIISPERRKSMQSGLSAKSPALTSIKKLQERSTSTNTGARPRERTPSVQRTQNSQRAQSSQRTASRSPSRTASRQRNMSRSPSRGTQRRAPSKSPTRFHNWDSTPRKLSPTPPVGREVHKRSSSKLRNASVTRRSPSPQPSTKRKTLREITTQTSFNYNSFDDPRSSTPNILDALRREELKVRADIKVKGWMDYTNDLAMFVLACWLYLFYHEMAAVPVLFIMVFRQLQSQIKKRIPNWILKRFQRKEK